MLIANGAMSAGMRKTIGIVASQSRNREWRRAGGFARGGAAGVESANGDWALYRNDRSLGPRDAASCGLARQALVGRRG